MSETAETLIKSALRTIGAIASGETPTTDEYADGLEAMKFMFRHWSSRNIKLYFTTQDVIPLTGASSYTIGTGGACNSARPSSIRGAYIGVSGGTSYPVTIIDEDKFRSISLKTLPGPAAYLWYNPEYPLGKIWLWPVGSGTLYVDSLKPLTEPSSITSSISFPPEYDEAIKYNLALRLCPEFGKEPSQMVTAFAIAALASIETKNFASQINVASPEILRIARGANRHANFDMG